MSQEAKQETKPKKVFKWQARDGAMICGMMVNSSGSLEGAEMFVSGPGIEISWRGKRTVIPLSNVASYELAD